MCLANKFANYNQNEASSNLRVSLKQPKKHPLSQLFFTGSKIEIFLQSPDKLSLALLVGKKAVANNSILIDFNGENTVVDLV